MLRTSILKRSFIPTGLLGVLQYGVHVNGYFTDGSGQVFMWLARRSPTKQTWPSKLDQIVRTVIEVMMIVLVTCKNIR